MPMKNRSDIKESQSEIHVSIDRLTVIGSYPTELFEKNYFEWQRKYNFVRECGEGLQIVDTTQYVNSGEDLPEEQVAFIEVPKFQPNKLRLDFNPNHGLETPGGKWILDLIASMKNKHYSRGDFAFDILNNSRAEYYRVWKFGISQSIFLSRKREMQTIYYGSPKSGQQIRQYNKLVEQQAKGKDPVNVTSWWRVELQLRTGKVKDYPELVKQMLADFYVPDYQQVANINQKNMVYRLMNDPDAWGELGQSTSYKYHKFFKEMPHENGLAIEMAKKFVSEFARLENELQSIMNRFDIQADETATE